MQKALEMGFEPVGPEYAGFCVPYDACREYSDMFLGAAATGVVIAGATAFVPLPGARIAAAKIGLGSAVLGLLGFTISQFC